MWEDPTARSHGLYLTKLCCSRLGMFWSILRRSKLELVVACPDARAGHRTHCADPPHLVCPREPPLLGGTRQGACSASPCRTVNSSRVCLSRNPKRPVSLHGSTPTTEMSVTLWLCSKWPRFATRSRWRSRLRARSHGARSLRPQGTGNGCVSSSHSPFSRNGGSTPRFLMWSRSKLTVGTAEMGLCRTISILFSRVRFPSFASHPAGLTIACRCRIYSTQYQGGH